MIASAQDSCSALLLLALASVPFVAMATDEACAGVTQKCTKDTTYDKTIGGSIYSCYDCRQALCKDGGNGGISGTATSSVCTEKATTFRPISLDDQSRGGDTLAPKPVASRRPGRDVDPRPAQFDEADALFSKRLHASDAEQRERERREDRSQTPRDHREQPVRNDGIVEIVDGTSNTHSAQALQAPSDLAIRNASPTALMLAWRDNSTDEFGVELYRADSNQRRLDPENTWTLVGTFQERKLDNVAGTGMRRDEDAGLSPGARYCYRMRAYSGLRRTQVSGFSDVACAQTTSPASSQTGGPRSRGARPASPRTNPVAVSPESTPSAIPLRKRECTRSGGAIIPMPLCDTKSACLISYPIRHFVCLSERAIESNSPSDGIPIVSPNNRVDIPAAGLVPPPAAPGPIHIPYPDQP